MNLKIFECKLNDFNSKQITEIIDFLLKDFDLFDQ